MQALGKHVLAEFYKCDHKVLNNVSLIEQLMNDAAIKVETTIILREMILII